MDRRFRIVLAALAVAAAAAIAWIIVAGDQPPATGNGGGTVRTVPERIPPPPELPSGAPPYPELSPVAAPALPDGETCGLVLNGPAGAPVLVVAAEAGDDAPVPAAMIVDAEPVLLLRSRADGPERAQQSLQVFERPEDGITVVVRLAAGEGVRGELTVMKRERSTLKIGVTGDVGC